MEPQIDPIVTRFYHAFEGFVIARGLLTPIALEAGLKIQETTYSRFRAVPMSEFLHGPIAQLEPHMPVIVIACDVATDAFAADVLHRLQREIRADIFLITNRADLCEYANQSLVMPTACEGLAGGLCAIVLMQLFVLKLSLSRGIDTDNPRGLKKVTITR